MPSPSEQLVCKKTVGTRGRQDRQPHDRAVCRVTGNLFAVPAQIQPSQPTSGRTSPIGGLGLPRRCRPSTSGRQRCTHSDGVEYFLEQAARDHHVGHLKGDRPTVSHDPGADLHQLVAMRRRRPVTVGPQWVDFGGSGTTPASRGWGGLWTFGKPRGSRSCHQSMINRGRSDVNNPVVSMPRSSPAAANHCRAVRSGCQM
jgi:hypothetical protein